MPVTMIEEPQSAPELPMISGPSKCASTIQIELISDLSPEFAKALAYYATDLANRTLREVLAHLTCCVITPAAKYAKQEGVMPDLRGAPIPIFSSLSTGVELVPVTAEEFAAAKASAEAGAAMVERTGATVQ